MPAEDVLTLDVEYVDVHAFADNTAVGHRYQVGINGVGYMLADHPEKGDEYRRQVIPLDPQRLATSDTPFSEAIERYSFAAADTWESGSCGPRSLGTRCTSRLGTPPCLLWPLLVLRQGP